MAKVIGQLQEVYEKQMGNYGSAVFIKVGNTEYKFGKFPPKAQPGDWVEFEATSKQNGNYTNHSADYKTFRKSSAPAGGAAPTPAPTPMPPVRSGGGFSDDRQEVISKQAALNTGFNIFSKLVDLGAITPPSSVKKAQLYDFYMAALHNEAAKCYNLSTGKKWDIEAAIKPQAEVDDFVDDEIPAEDSPGW